MMKILKNVFAACCLCTLALQAQITERSLPPTWDGLVKGTRFVDRFLPMPQGVKGSRVWGTAGVQNRYVDNGIEDCNWSYWGGNILSDADGKYHLFVCGWPEGSLKGHMEWPASWVFHAVSDSRFGPFRIQQVVGRGHNPEIYRLRNGSYVLYVIGGCYKADHLNGPWTYDQLHFDARDRPIIEGLSNLTFAEREDGSRLMICRGGGVWISKDGWEEYKQLSDKSVYPAVAGEFEDPVVWRDSIQYHLIVNDWLGRIAYYQRSKDGLHWITEPGEAYLPGVAFHANGEKEEWFKYERIKIFQDTYGRAIQANFAVIDTLKLEDKPRDRHSSKNIAVPLNPGVRLEMLNTSRITAKTKEIRLRIRAEEGFDPNEAIDFSTLRLGDATVVNFGKGCRVKNIIKKEGDVVVVFDGRDHGLTRDEFALKLVGKYKDGSFLFGYVRLPEVNYLEPMLSCRKPVFIHDNAVGQTVCCMTMENFGQVPSEGYEVKIVRMRRSKADVIGKRKFPRLAPYESAVLEIPCGSILVEEETEIDVVITDASGRSEHYRRPYKTGR